MLYLLYHLAPNCGNHMHYKDCAPSCIATCSNPLAPYKCPFRCVGACECDPGYLFENGQCIKPQQCGCVDSNGYYHKVL